MEAQVLRRAARPQGRRHRLRLRRVPRRRRPLPRRARRRGVDRRGPRQRPPQGPLHHGPSARSSPTASTAPTSTTWPSRCASSRCGSSRSTATCRSPSSTTRSSSATRCSASPASTSSASCTSTRRACRLDEVRLSSTSTSTPSSARPSTCASASPPRSTTTTRTQQRRQAPPARRAPPRHRDLRQIADGVIAAGLPLGGKPGKALDEAYDNLRLAVKQAHPAPTDGEPRHDWLDGIIDRGLTPTVATDYERWQPLHWVLEAPDVIVDHGGFDAIVGNPPFLGGKKLIGAMGSNVRDWLVESSLAGGTGQRRPCRVLLPACYVSLLNRRGTLGLIATNTIAQGDTREVGLDQLVEQRIRDHPCDPEPAVAGGEREPGVRGGVGHVGRRCGAMPLAVPTASRVRANHDAPRAGWTSRGRSPIGCSRIWAIASIGCIVLGMGSCSSQTRHATGSQRTPANARGALPVPERRRPELAPDCSAPRWVIDFNDRIETSAAQLLRRHSSVSQRR